MSKIEKAESVLAVYIETPATNHPVIADDDIQCGYRLLAQAFPKNKIDLLYLTNRVGRPETVKISENITRLYLNYKRKKTGGTDYAVETSVLKKVFRNYRLNGSASQRRHRLLWRFLSNFILNKKSRHKFRDRHHV